MINLHNIYNLDSIILSGNRREGILMSPTSRIISIWALIFAAGMFVTVLFAAQYTARGTIDPTPAVTSVR